ncbi:UNVERIFIED_CONTAM: Retrovirus-related Pol polyprotein from transposon RE1 [Sesamum latifolium]|uniref:Retrovirus-related Pol polyprotein from transposon RE1 n=1 Tax=Sesamum latifolium TaxID=2727402 RepID=A0AAW2XDI9_9LAMI
MTLKWQDLTTKQPLAVGTRVGKLYVLDTNSFSASLQQVCHSADDTSSNTEKYVMWHKRLGHPSPVVLTHIGVLNIDTLNKDHEPSTYSQAKGYKEWKDAMSQELHSLEKNNTWEVVPMPKDKRAIGVNGCIRFSPVAKAVTVRTFLAVATGFGWPIHQVDINNAFLHGFLEEDIYMKAPEGYHVQSGQICKLKRSLYGLKQASRQWNLELTSHLISYGFVQSSYDHCLFTKQSVEEPFRRLVGRLLYLSFTRPDISFGAQQLSQFVHAPCQVHLDAALHLVRYLKGCPERGLFFPASNSFTLTGYCDADWASCVDTRRSLTCYCIFLGGALISWKTKKQTTVARSTVEAEYRSLATTACELQWVTYLLSDLLVQVPTPIPLYCDNQAAIHIVANPVFYERTKHIEIDCHLVRDKFKSGFVLPQHISGTEQLADVLTKSLSGFQFSNILSKMGLMSFPQVHLEGGDEES